MFTGFASENTPAIQVWDFFRPFASTFTARSVSLADDCAPIQVFRTGATAASNIKIYLPTAPIEGKQITIVNQNFGSNPQKIDVCSSDISGNGSESLLNTLGAGDSLVIVYSKQNISFGTQSGSRATGWISLNKSSNSSANYFSAVVGGNNNSATSASAFVGGGDGNSAGGQNSVIVGGQFNTANGSNSASIGGSSNQASQTNTVVVGGSQNTAGSSGSSVTGGQFNSASGTLSAVLGGSNNSANSERAVVIGGGVGTARSIIGNFVIPASVFPIGGQSGVQQLATLLLGRQTTDATATRLTSNSSAASTTNQVILPNNSAYTFQGTCVANVTGGGDSSGWKFEGVIKRGANAASTALVAAVTPLVIAQDVGAATWVLAITADTTNGGIAVTVTGAAATTIRWVVKIETTEVTF
jgi:hypothetical protein